MILWRVFKEGRIIGNGVVIDPVRLRDEITRTEAAGAKVKEQLLISRKANLILPTHSLLDKAKELAKGDKKIGSTLRGIGPTYRDKVGRSGIRVGDISTPNFKQKYEAVKKNHISLIQHYADIEFDMDALDTEFFEATEFLKTYTWIDTEYYINKAIKENKKILAEGAQGSMLDVDFGSYPYVTSSNTIAGELDNDLGQRLRDAGHEYGATTGRPRRTGWLDMVALKYAVMLSGVNELIMMKSDTLSGFDYVEVATSYDVDGENTDEIPYDICDATVEPQYTRFAGWAEDISQMKETDQLPVTFIQYVEALEQMVGVPIKILSVGPDRAQTIFNGAFEV